MSSLHNSNDTFVLDQIDTMHLAVEDRELAKITYTRASYTVDWLNQIVCATNKSIVRVLKLSRSLRFGIANR